ncbi:NADase-type glycan-binding domain-containing protein [Tessaracoccus sp.]
MPKRLPDELFRDAGAPESPDVRGDVEPSAPPRTRTRAPFRVRRAKEIAPPMVVAGVVGALLLGFGVGKLVALQADVVIPPSTTSGPATASAPVDPSAGTTLAPWNNSVSVVPILAANGRCKDSISVNPASNLLDDDPSSVWSCRGAGAGEEITFSLERGEVVVGVRLVNGNTITPERYLAERRILSVRWTFSDGSWMMQGLAANDREPQEIRFPPITISGDVTMTVLSATVPGETDLAKDAVSISSLEFLGVG